MNALQQTPRADPGIRVAILEDQPLVRDSMAAALEQAGMSVVVATGEPRSFLQRIAASQPSVAVLDLVIEGSDGSRTLGGLEALREMNRFHPNVATLVVTGDRSTNLLADSYRAGASGFIEKWSVGFEGLLGAIQAVARGEMVFPVEDVITLMELGDSQRKPNPLSALTSRERQVLALVAGGSDNLKISAMLHIAERTVKAHISKLYQKLGSENRTQLALLARQLGVKPPTGM